MAFNWSHAEFPTVLAALRHVYKELIQKQRASHQSLLLRIAGERLQCVPVALGQAVFPRVRAEQILLLLPCRAVPGERHDAGVLQPPHREAFCLLEGIEHIDRNPWMALQDFTSDPEHMHDGKN